MHEINHLKSSFSCVGFITQRDFDKQSTADGIYGCQTKEDTSPSPFSHPLNLLCFRTRRKPGSSYPSCRGLDDQRPWSNTSSAARASNSTCQKKPASSRSCSPVGDPLVWEVVPLQTLYLRSELTQPPASLKLQWPLSPIPANFISKWCDWHVTYAAYDLAFPSPYAEPNWLMAGRAHHFWVTAVVIFIRNAPPCQDEEHEQVWAGLDSVKKVSHIPNIVTPGIFGLSTTL